jgi:hypothetical protein
VLGVKVNHCFSSASSNIILNVYIFSSLTRHNEKTGLNSDLYPNKLRQYLLVEVQEVNVAELGKMSYTDLKF